MQPARIRLALAAGVIALLGLSSAGCSQSGWMRGGSAGQGSGSVHWMSTPASLDDAMRAWQRGEHERAVAHAKRAMRRPLRESDLMTASVIVCAGRLALDQPAAALPYCGDAVAISGGRDWRQLNNRANALLQVGQLADAISDYEQAMLLLQAADDEGAIAQVGIVQGNLALARERRALELEGVASTQPASPAP